MARIASAQCSNLPCTFCDRLCIQAALKHDASIPHSARCFVRLPLYYSSRRFLTNLSGWRRRAFTRGSRTPLRGRTIIYCGQAVHTGPAWVTVPPDIVRLPGCCLWRSVLAVRVAIGHALCAHVRSQHVVFTDIAHTLYTEPTNCSSPPSHGRPVLVIRARAPISLQPAETFAIDDSHGGLCVTIGWQKTLQVLSTEI